MTARPCARLHPVRGEHLERLLTPDDDPADPGCARRYGKCRGCRPAVVADTAGVHEQLCDACKAQIMRVLLDLDGLLDHVRLHVRPGTANPRQDVLREAPAPLTVAAVDDADALHAVVHTWALRYAYALGLAGPQVTRSAVRWDDDEWPVGIMPGRDPMVTYAVVQWLIPHADGLSSGLHPDTRAADAVAWYRDLTSTYWAVENRWPRAPKERRLSLPCPGCDRLMLHMHPPSVQGADVTVMCHRCGFRMTEDDYYWRVHEVRGEKRTAS